MFYKDHTGFTQKFLYEVHVRTGYVDMYVFEKWSMGYRGGLIDCEP